MRLFCFISIVIIFAACEKQYEAPVPVLKWNDFEIAAKLSYGLQQNLEGIYSIDEGDNFFGPAAVVKTSYIITGTDTLFHISFFFASDASYVIFEGRRNDSTILLDGYWRKMVNTETGRMRLTISYFDGAENIFNGIQPVDGDTLKIKGSYGFDNDLPENKITFNFSRRLNTSRPFKILAHRCGGRTSDLLPASENSLGMILLASRFGSEGVEMDVRLTRDGIPVLYHDDDLNLRLIQDNGLVGSIEDYSYNQLSTMVRLIDGQKIPTLRDALETVLYQTSLEFVWLDTKNTSSLSQIHDLQQEFKQKAAQAGRSLEIVIGIPDDGQRDRFLALPGYQGINSLCELGIDDARLIHADYWAPRWTSGLQNAEVAAMHSEGREVIVWTLDEPQYIFQYISQGNFDGILTNYPSLTAYYIYASP
jgi:glycerophosphoryl diester phosphodiesterase